jgi:hypothetical protein
MSRGELEETHGESIVLCFTNCEVAFDGDWVRGVVNREARFEGDDDRVLDAGGLAKAAVEEAGDQGEACDVSGLVERDHVAVETDAGAGKPAHVGGDLAIFGGVFKIAQRFDRHLQHFPWLWRGVRDARGGGHGNVGVGGLGGGGSGLTEMRRGELQQREGGDGEGDGEDELAGGHYGDSILGLFQ